MHITRLELENVLSFGPSQTIELAPLNICIGANGSGKSNLIEALNLLRHCATDLSKPFIESGGISDWIFRNARQNYIGISSHFDNSGVNSMELIHRIFLKEKDPTFEVDYEYLGPIGILSGMPNVYIYSEVSDKEFKNRISDSGNVIPSSEVVEVGPRKSLLTYNTHNGISFTANRLRNWYSNIRLYREWGIGKNSSPRQPARTDSVDEFLREDFSNLALILNELGEVPAREKQFIEYLNRINASFSGFGVRIIQNFALLYLKEHAFASGTIPSTRLSDGTLRMLCLLAILLHPTPPPLICIEEPEVGLHPDLMPTIAELLKDASTRTQLIVTTHSDILVDCFSDTPEAVLVFDKNPEDGISQVERLDKEGLAAWLEEYSLGRLWTKGVLGGTRW